MAKKASQILFGKSTQEDLSTLEEEWLLQVLEGVPKVKISRNVYESLSSVTELLTEATEGLIFASKGEARRLIQGGAKLTHIIIPVCCILFRLNFENIVKIKFF